MSVETKENAFKNFLYFDDETKPIKSSDSEAVQLEPTSAIVFIGYIPCNSERFAINLKCRSAENTAFHFNPRLDRGYIVRNSKIKGYWNDEETCSPAIPASRLFQRNSYFHLVIFCSSKEFYVSINGHHFCTFTYRLPLGSITSLEYVGDIEDVRFRLKTLCIYPDPRIIESLRKLDLSSQQPLTENLDVPATISINEGIQNGVRIFIKGRLKLLPHSFHVNLQNSPLIYPHSDIALHLNPRFQYGHQPPCVVMNCWTGGSWGREERHEGHLSWGPGRDFLLTIRCEFESYIIWLGNKMIGEFKHRVKPSIIDTLQISGDIVLYELALSLGE